MSTSNVPKQPRRYRRGVRKAASTKPEANVESPSLRPPPTTLEPRNPNSWPPQMISFSAIEKLFKEFREEYEARDPATRYGQPSDDEVVVYPRVLRWTSVLSSAGYVEHHSSL
ncbi:uncharacterized protein ARMOST_17498 [Armillaria ostoyae]|uniref:Uncharacterized protein n=1 Tax=Armillaria ostoyae TaxID=47428 RepID=A0A284RZB5_ARMOS|nr:uncharacterized protein ARMOST_17498 [Armillaria ostoyae]